MYLVLKKCYNLGLLFVGLLLLIQLKATAQTFRGVASYYGKQHQGKLTASGVPFDKNKLTAAHRTFPFGTRLKVCLDRCVTVVVNDRGPFVKGRILDISEAAAKIIGLRPRGTATVTLTRLSEDNQAIF
jgi:rare lipoprotein A